MSLHSISLRALARSAVLNVNHVHCHVHQPWLSSLKAIRLKSDHYHPDGKLTGKDEESDKPSKKRWKVFKARQATFYTKRPGTTSQELLLRLLKKFRQKKTYWDEISRDSELALVVLATPTFSTWLQDESFVAQLLESVLPKSPTSEEIRKSENIEAKSGNMKSMTMDVVCACVDGLSPHLQQSHSTTALGVLEGFSILQGPTSMVLPDLWNETDTATASSPTMTASITFEDRKSSQRRNRIVVPLANTLFSNGRHSTLLISRWAVNGNSIVKVRTSEKKSQIVNICTPRNQSLGTTSIHVPAFPLTPARRIISGLGNIVKQLDFEGEGRGPASRELEAYVDEYMLQTGQQKSAVAVWALVIPKKLDSQAEAEELFKLVVDPEAVKTQWQEALPNTNFIGYWISRGARFCRVLSGGGGWGVKQGLLSLDPQSTYSEISDARFDFSTGSLEEQQASALGNIAEPDAYIQFFIMKHNQLNNVVRNQTPFIAPFTTVAGDDVWQLETIFGTSPSTIDKLPVDPDLCEAKPADIFFRPGHFGALSETGLFLSSPSKVWKASKGNGKRVTAPAIQAKIDLPYSYIYRDYRNRRRVKSVGKENVTASQLPIWEEAVNGPRPVWVMKKDNQASSTLPSAFLKRNAQKQNGLRIRYYYTEEEKLGKQVSSVGTEGQGQGQPSQKDQGPQFLSSENLLDPPEQRASLSHKLEEPRAPNRNQ